MKIFLTQDKFALCDAKDYKWLSKYKWCVNKVGHSWYARSYRGKKNGKQVYVYMHREIMKPPKGYEVDHINGNGLDNRRSNLRVVTRTQNNLNKHHKTTNKTSQYIGVCFDNTTCGVKRWLAQLVIDGKCVLKKRFHNEEDAYKARKKAEKDNVVL